MKEGNGQRTLSADQPRRHDDTRPQPSEEALEARLSGQRGQSLEDVRVRVAAFALVYLAEKRVGGVRKNGGGDTLLPKSV
jgi:hypothetical protein